MGGMASIVDVESLREKTFRLMSQMGENFHKAAAEKFLDEPRRSEELVKIFDTQLKEKRYEDARETAKLLPGQICFQQLLVLLEKEISGKKMKDAEKTAQLILSVKHDG